jgi:Chaperone of endosialidase
MPLPKVTSGALITAAGWNNMIDEIDGKLSLTGGGMTGPLAISHNSGGVLTNNQLAITETQANDYARLSFHNSNAPTQAWHIGGLLSATPGVTPRLNFWFNGLGDALSLFSTGRVEMLQGTLFFGSRVTQHINLWTTEYGLGVQSGTTYFRTGGDFSWFRGGSHNDAQGNPGAGGTRLMTLNGAGDLILCGRSNPTNDPAKSACRALVNWKASANAPDQLYINWANDFAGGTHIGSSLHLAGSDLYFTQTNHIHTGIGNTPGHAAIENASDYSALMILGRMVSGRRQIRMWDDVRVEGNFYVTNLPFGDRGNAQYEAATGRFFYDNSSRRYKQDIRPLEDDFKNILRLQPRTYVREHAPEHTEIGYIAEELQSLGLDRLLYLDDKGLPDGLNYQKVCIYLLEVLRDHEAKLNPKSPYLERYVEDVSAPAPKASKKTTKK